MSGHGDGDADDGDSLTDGGDGRGSEAGTKTLDEVYAERNLLALAFIRAHVEAHEGVDHGWWMDETSNCESATGADRDDETGGDDEWDPWVVVWAETAHGQVGWHVRRSLLPEWMPKRDPNYDGYGTPEKNRRLRRVVGESGTGADTGSSGANGSMDG